MAGWLFVMGCVCLFPQHHTAASHVSPKHLPESTPTAILWWHLKPTQSDSIMSIQDSSCGRKRREGHIPVQIPRDTTLASGLWPS